MGAAGSGWLGMGLRVGLWCAWDGLRWTVCVGLVRVECGLVKCGLPGLAS